jgi:hypothetical protein
MRTDADRDVWGWLDAEAAGRADEADIRFRTVSRRLEPVAVPAGFADAVLARLGAARAVRDAYSERWVRAAVAASLLLVGGVAALVPLDAWIGALLTAVQAVAIGFGRVVVGGRAWLSSGVALWGGLADAGAVIGRQLLGPVPLGLLALNLAIALCAFTVLRRLMALQEN